MNRRLAVVPGYLERVEQLADRLARFNMILDHETRADIVFIQQYARECRRIVELELRDQQAAAIGHATGVPD